MQVRSCGHTDKARPGARVGGRPSQQVAWTANGACRDPCQPLSLGVSCSKFAQPPGGRRMRGVWQQKQHSHWTWSLAWVGRVFLRLPECSLQGPRNSSAGLSVTTFSHPAVLLRVCAPNAPRQHTGGAFVYTTPGLEGAVQLPIRPALLGRGKASRSRTWEHVIFIASFSSHSFRKSIITWYSRRNQGGHENMFGSGTSPAALSNTQSTHHNHAPLLQRVAEAAEA